MVYEKKVKELRRLYNDLTLFKDLQQSIDKDYDGIQTELKSWISIKENDINICLNEMSSPRT